MYIENNSGSIAKVTQNHNENGTLMIFNIE